MLDFESKELIIDQILKGGGYLFAIEAFDLEEADKDWLGTAFAVGLGIASIFTGFALLAAASSVFLTSFATALVMQGIGNVIQATVSVVTGNPIDCKQFAKAQALATGINIATAGLFHFANMVPGLAGGFIQTGMDSLRTEALNVGQFLGKALTIQAVTMGADILLKNAAKNLIDQGDIAEDARKLINNVIEENGETLAKIYATDALNAANSHAKELQNMLYQKIDGEMVKHQNLFHKDKVEAGVKVASNVGSHVLSGLGLPGLGGLVETGTRMTMGIVKNSQAFGKIYKGTRNVIREVGEMALSTGELMRLQLGIEFGPDLVPEVFGALELQGYIVSGQMDYRNCDKLGNAQLSGTFSVSRVIASCDKIADLLLNPGNFAALSERFVSSMTQLVSHIQREGIINPVAGAVAGAAGSKLGGGIYEFLESEFSRKSNNDQTEQRQGSKRNPYWNNEREEELAHNNFGKGGNRGNRGNRPWESPDTEFGGGAGSGSGSGEGPGGSSGSGQGDNSGSSYAGGSGSSGNQGGHGNQGSKTGQGGQGGQGSQNGNQGNPTGGETPGWMGVDETLIAGNGPSRESGHNFGENINEEFTYSTFTFEKDGKKYMVYGKGHRVYGGEGNEIVREDLRIEAIEINKYDPEITLTMPVQGGHKVAGNINIDGAGGFGGLEANMKEAIESGIVKAFDSANNGLGNQFEITINNGASGYQYQETILPLYTSDDGNGGRIAGIWPSDYGVIPEVSELRSQPQAPEQSPIGSSTGGGMVGSGLLSMEDAQAMKEFLSSEEVKNYLAGVKEGIITAPKEIVLEVKDLANAVFEYSKKPMGAKIAEVLVAIEKYRLFNWYYDWDDQVRIIGGKIYEVGWHAVDDIMTNPEEQGRLLVESVFTAGTLRFVKKLKAVFEGVEEAIDMTKRSPAAEVAERKVCPNDLGLAEKNLEVTQKVKIGDGKLEFKDWDKKVTLDELNIANPDFDILYSSASEAYKDTTKLAHALSKHAGRHPEIWGNTKGAPKTWHIQAQEHLTSIIDGPGYFQKITDSKTGISWIEKRLSDGRGVRLNLDNTFKGFLSPNE